MKLVDNKTLKEICKMGQGNDCCRYIICGADGIECGKGTEFQLAIDANVSKMTAKGDNCKGL